MAPRTAHVALGGLLLLAALACSVEARSKCPVDKILRSLQQAAGGNGGFHGHHPDKQQQQQHPQPSAHQQPPPRAHRKLQQTGTYPGTGPPSQRDWASVVSACRALTSYEKRFCNFYVRASFHDSLSTTATCTMGPGCGGLDGSLILNVSELARPENAYEDFSILAGRSAIRIANWYSISVADAIAVCGATCTTGLNGPDVLSYTTLRVGRIDSTAAGPAGQLAAADATTDQFAQFFTSRGFSISEAAALMGSHALIDEQRCFRGTGGNTRNYCDPTKESCWDVNMFNFAGERYFTDMCTPKIVMVQDAELPPSQVEGRFDPFVTEGEMVRSLEPEEYESLRVDELCSWTSPEQRRNAMALMADLRSGKTKGAAIPQFTVTPVWVNTPSMCSLPGVPTAAQANCPHTKSWFYTVNDGWLAAACQGALPVTATNTALKTEMSKFTVRDTWRRAYSLAFAKMINVGANWASPATVMNIAGVECFSGFFHPTKTTVNCTQAGCTPTGGCPATAAASGCICRSAFNNGRALKAGTSVSSVVMNQYNTAPPSPLTTMQVVQSAVQSLYFDPNANTPGTALVDPDAGLIDPDVMTTTAGTATWNPLVSPYMPSTAVCSTNQAYSVDGFPSSPYRIIPFSVPFKNPAAAPVKGRSCRGDGHCAVAFDIPVSTVSLNVFGGTIPGCVGKTTPMMAYGGTVPGPTIIAPVGHEAIVQFRNNINTGFELGHEPCNPKFGRPTGRPISIHLHGSASLAPWDGWAEDETCTGEEKTYVYPNNRPTTGWYHDHGLHVTAENAYFGLAGFYLMSDQKQYGGCGAPYNMDNMEELHLMLADRVIDSNCGLYLDTQKFHRNNVYGDITLVSGIPYPRMDLQPKWYRLRLVNTGIVRPYLLKLKDAWGRDVGPSMCKVIAGDGGYRQTPVDFPVSGLQMGVAERYEVVCDFSKSPGATFYLWNGRNRKFMKDTPYFCFSHLIARINVAASLPAGAVAPAFNITLAPSGAQLTALKVFTSSDYATALSMARAGTPHRRMKFGRRHGHWVVNGETWDTFKLAASDIGTNTWELWELQTGGGWFHPIHIHLVDFFVLSRTSIAAGTPDMSVDGVFSYEQMTPKDVVYLGPSQKLYVVARFGPHRGDYMFHCHNLIHEDNDMMRSMRMAPTGKTQSTVLPIQTAAAGLTLYDSYQNPMFTGTAAKVPTTPIVINDAFAASQLALNAYAIFYPTATQGVTINSATSNPWKVPVCPLPPVTAAAATG